MGVSRLRTERLVNLVICLLSSRRFLTAEKIASTVPGYQHDVSDTKAHEAFQRKFERDKAELRRLGVPLETGTNSVFDPEHGYRIARREYELPEIELTPSEAAALGVAARLWQHSKLATFADGGLWKLRAAGVDVRDDDDSEVAPVVTVDEAFTPVMAAVRERMTIRFSYLGTADDEATRRTVEPWGVVCYRGRWYLVGHDRGRDDTRCFRLSRVIGKVKSISEPDDFVPPTDIDLLDHVAQFYRPTSDTAPRRATVLVAPGKAIGIRRNAEQISARQPDGDRLVIPFTDARRLAWHLAKYGRDVVVLDPPDVRKEMATVLADIVAIYQAPSTASEIHP